MTMTRHGQRKEKKEKKELPFGYIAPRLEPANMVLRSPNGERVIEVNANPEAVQNWVAAGWRVVKEL